MLPTDNSEFVLAAALLRTGLILAWTFLTSVAINLITRDSFVVALGTAGGVAIFGAGLWRFAEGIYDVLRARRNLVNPGDVGQRAPPPP